MDHQIENNEQHFFYKFRSIDKELGSKAKCLLKGCHKIAKYSISCIKPENLTTEASKNYKQFVKFICSSHLENWDSIKVGLMDDKLTKEIKND